MSNGHSLEFEDLFDWEKESDRHYYKLLCNEKEWEEFEEKVIKPTLVKHETKSKPPKVRGTVKKVLQLRSRVLAQINRTRSRS